MNHQIETMFTVFLTFLRSLPGGETLVTIAATGVPILMAIVVWIVVVHLRGQINGLLMGAEERRKLKEVGNVAYRINQFMVALGLAVAVASALPYTTSITMFWRKVATALIFQLLAMIVLRWVCWKQHRAMMNKDVISGIELGMYVLCIATLTFCGVLRVG